MTYNNQNSQHIIVFHGFPALEEGDRFAGYSALISAHGLNVPVPDHLCAIGMKHKKYDYERWHIFTPRHRPRDTLYDNLVDLLIRFLSQNDGKLSKRARRREFEKLTDDETRVIEEKYAEIFD